MPALSSIPHLPVISPIVDYNTLKIKQNKNIRHAVLLSDNMPFQMRISRSISEGQSDGLKVKSLVLDLILN